MASAQRRNGSDCEQSKKIKELQKQFMLLVDSYVNMKKWHVNIIFQMLTNQPPSYMHLQEYANKYVNIMQQISELKALKRVNKTMF